MNLTIIIYAMPLLRGRAPYNQVLNMILFWLMTGGMAFMTFVLTFAGTIQTHMQRIVGDYYMDVQVQLGLFYFMRFGAVPRLAGTPRSPLRALIVGADRSRHIAGRTRRIRPRPDPALGWPSRTA